MVHIRMMRFLVDGASGLVRGIYDSSISADVEESFSSILYWVVYDVIADGNVYKSCNLRSLQN